VSAALIQVNATMPAAWSLGHMEAERSPPGSSRELTLAALRETLAELREKAALLCNETKDVIAEYKEIVRCSQLWRRNFRENLPG
jgi:hypothetical protein